MKPEKKIIITSICMTPTVREFVDVMMQIRGSNNTSSYICELVRRDWEGHNARELRRLQLEKKNSK